MSLCINDDLIWISIPRCASSSIEFALRNSKLNIKLFSHYLELKKKSEEGQEKHAHYRLNELYNEFGIKKTICVYRDPIERFVSGLMITLLYLSENHNTIIKLENLNNDFIYKNINQDFFNRLFSVDLEQIFLCYKSLITDEVNFEDIPEGVLRSFWILLPQDFWKMSEKCTYEFDLKNLNKLEEFINNRYDVNIKIPKINETPFKIKNKIILDKDLRDYLTIFLRKCEAKGNTLI